jgi:type I restriction enzyme R subunit
VTDGAAPRYEPIAVSSESTVVAEFIPDPSQETGYQSEAELERTFIELLREQAYEYLPLTSEGELIANLRTQLEALNGITFSMPSGSGSSPSGSPATRTASSTRRSASRRTTSSSSSATTGRSRTSCSSTRRTSTTTDLQVINQYEVDGTYANRYDVTVLVNGLPMVHIELKRRGVDIREAFNQINRYQRDSFWAGSGLFEYVQLFVISNGTLTKYYSNTTRTTAPR